MKKVIIMRGCSGSGKSTWAKKFKEEQDLEVVIVSADNYWFDAEGNYNFNPARLGEAHAYCYKTFVENLEQRVPIVIVDNTNTTLAEIAPYLTHAQYHGYKVEIVRCTCPYETAAQRNVHGVPAKTVESMYKRMQNLPRHWPKEEVIVTG